MLGLGTGARGESDRASHEQNSKANIVRFSVALPTPIGVDLPGEQAKYVDLARAEEAMGEDAA